jgi:hypothetical protein
MNKEIDDERTEIKLWNYVFENCGCQYIKHERAFSAFITVAGYDYQEYELDEHSARVKLADSIFCQSHIVEWYNKKLQKNAKR